MAQVLYQNFWQNVAPVTLTTTGETIIITSNSIDWPTGANFALILAYLSLSLSAATTGITLRVRRGNALTGAVVATTGVITSGVTASTVWADGFNAVDNPAPSDLAQYSLTAQVAGASGNSTTSLQSIALFLF